MNKEKIDKIISNLGNSNPIFIHKDDEYTNELISNLEKLNNITEEKLESLLCVKSKYNLFTFNQGISELFIYFLLNKQNINFVVEENENKENGSNVDVAALYEGVKFNIEVKSPSYPIKNAEKLVGSFVNRFGNKENNDLMMKQLSCELEQHLDGTDYKGVKIQNLTDNRVKDCLLSAQNKFDNPSNDCLNILFLCTTTSEMQSYWQYVVNSNSGFFNEHSDVSSFFADENQSIPLEKNMYDKVSAIVLTNAISLNERYEKDSWDIDKAITLVLSNPFCKYKEYNQYRILDKFFKNLTIEFYQGLCEFVKAKPDIPNFLYFSEFACKNGFSLKEETK
jgi:hypothetical protein